MHATIQEIEAHAIYGNAYSDMALFNKIHAFIHAKDTSMREKVRALNVLDKAIGEEQTANEIGVEQYIELTKE